MKKIKEKINLIEQELGKIGDKKNQKLFLNEMKKIGIEKLPYSYSSLKQFIDPETMEYHYNKHYKGYVDKLNGALSKKDYGDLQLEEIVKSISKYNKTIRNNAGGAFNHALFWKMLSSEPQRPHGNVLKQIKKDFKNYSSFKKKFEEVAKERFGSGWVWVVLNKRNKLKIVSTPNQDNPLMDIIDNGGYPILGLDLWEHAYYLKYKNKRNDYIKNFWKAVNWDFVNKLYNMRLKTKLNESKLLKKIINESKSERCSRQANESIRFIFNANPKVKHTFRKGIDEILKNMFSDSWYEKDEYKSGEMSGIYNLEKKGRSIINKLNTNYNSFCVLFSDVNQILNREGRTPLNLSGIPPFGQINETKKFVEYLKEFQEQIFNKKSNSFQNIMRILEETSRWGDKRENDTITKLEEKFNHKNVTKLGKLGGEVDMIRGVDVEVKKGNKTYDGQIKPFSHIKENNNKIVVNNTANVKKYTTDWMIFTNKKETLIFDNSSTQIIEGKYVFPSDSLIYTL